MMKLMKERGFTLIELLVVIAIIGILAAVVLASLNDARKSGNDAAIKQSMASIRSQAEIFYNETSFAYTGLCASTQINTLEAAIQKNNGGTAPYCNQSATEWVVSSPLLGGGHWCVDGTGAARQISAAATGTVCPAT